MSPNRNRSSNAYRSSRSKPTPSLSQAAANAIAATGGGLIAVLLVLAFIALVFIAIGAVLGWLGMLIAGMLGVSVGFATAWPVGICTAVLVRFLRS